MKRKMTCVLVALFLIPALLTGCSSGGASSATTPKMMETEMKFTNSAGGGDGFYGTTEQSKADAGHTAEESGETQAIREAKLIRRAQLYIQTKDFDGAVQALDTLRERLGGYYENAEINGGDFYQKNATRYANYTIRVPKTQYTAFLSAAGEVGHVVSSSESQEDVGEAYYDAELRLKTQQIKQDRLISLLEKAEKMEDIISLESALSEVQYQIEQYTSSLKRYDALVDYATIHVDLTEVLEIKETTAQTMKLSSRVESAFGDGLSSVGSAMSDFAVWCAYHFMGILFTAGMIGIVLLVLRRRVGKRRVAPVSTIESENK